jgi:DNA modification methylase
VIRGDAAHLPLADDSVDLIVTSPPYFALRSYRDEGEHYEGQIGSEPTPAEFLEALWRCTEEWQRVLKPTGSMFVNLGDKMAGSGGANQSGVDPKGTRRGGAASYNKSTVVEDFAQGARDGHRRSRPAPVEGIRAKSLVGFPWRYALGCIDGRAGRPMILRAEIVWSKANGMPESVKDRVRRSHEQWFHLTTEGRYYTAVDELREKHAASSIQRAQPHRAATKAHEDTHEVTPDRMTHAAGKLPGSVWHLPTEPLAIPDWAKQKYGLPDHFAAFPTEWPRRLILGWSPPAICLECGEGRRPAVDVEVEVTRGAGTYKSGAQQIAEHGGERGYTQSEYRDVRRTIRGYVCSCCPRTEHEGDPEADIGKTHAQGVEDGEYASQAFGGKLANRPRRGAWTEWHLERWTPPPSRPAVVLDPFSGTGTVAMVASALGRHGVGVDLSHDYCKLARWRCGESGHQRKAIGRTWSERQQTLGM